MRRNTHARLLQETPERIYKLNMCILHTEASMKKQKSNHPKMNLPKKPKTKFVKAANQYVTTAFDENGKQIQTWSVSKP